MEDAAGGGAGAVLRAWIGIEWMGLAGLRIPSSTTTWGTQHCLERMTLGELMKQLGGRAGAGRPEMVDCRCEVRARRRGGDLVFAEDAASAAKALARSCRSVGGAGRAWIAMRRNSAGKAWWRRISRGFGLRRRRSC